MTTGRYQGVRRWIGLVGAAFVPVAPILAAGLLVVHRFIASPRAPGRGWRSWVLIWLPALALILALRGAQAFQLPEFTGPLILLTLGLCVRPLAARQVTMLWAGLLVFVGLFLTQRYVAANTWHPSLQTTVMADRYAALLSPQRLSGGAEPSWSERRWSGLASGTVPELVLQVRHSAGLLDRAWFASDPSIEIVPVEGRAATARVIALGDGQPYLTRRVMTGGPLSGRTFRVAIEMRAFEPLAFTAANCRGVLLREVGGSGAAACFAQSITTQWHTHDFEWTVPAGATSETLRVELRIPETQYEVGAVTIQELTAAGLRLLGPLEPTGLRVAFAPPGSAPLAWSGPTLLPGNEWTNFKVPVPSQAISQQGNLRVLLRAEPGTTFEVRSAQLRTPDGPVGQPVALPQRASLWFGHPNLAAHAIAGATILVAALSATPIATVVATTAGIVGTSVTGSRTAFLAIGLSSVLLLVLALVRQRNWRTVSAAMLAACLLTLAGTAGPIAARLDLVGAGDGNQVSRAQIWSFALHEMLANPWGTDQTPFDSSWLAAQQADRRPAPLHAHNLWLQYGAEYGFPGLAVALFFSVGLIVITGPRRRPAATAGVIGLLALQVTDYSLFFFPIALCVLLLAAPSRLDTGLGEPPANRASPMPPRTPLSG